MVIFPYNDFKYYAWSFELNQIGVKTLANTKSYIFTPAVLINQILRGEKIDAFIFRYLNDRKSYFKTIGNALTDILLIGVCYIKKIKVMWISHNVDKETYVYHKYLSDIRRKTISSCADKIFVTDPLLMDMFIRKGISSAKVDWISFGPPGEIKSNNKNKSLFDRIASFKEILAKQSKKQVLLGLCVSSPLPKFYHFLNATKLVQDDPLSDYCIGLVLIGKMPEGKKFEIAREQIKSNSRILYIEDNFPVDEYKLKPLVDFFYRAVNDYSVPYTVFVAMSLQKPVLTDNLGFLPRLVEEYGIGATIPDPETRTADWFQQFLASWDPKNANKFLSQRSWKHGAQKIFSAL